MSNLNPIIGITTYAANELNQFYLPRAYVDSVRSEGGFPILLPPGESRVHDAAEFIDGLMFAGGGDIDPSKYDGKHHSSIERVNAERDEFEISLAKLVFHSNTPVLGICRGMQVLSVSSGGDLIQNIPDTLPPGILHRGEGRTPAQHSVHIEKKSHLGKIFGVNEIQVQSSHHQGLHTIPSQWNIAAHSPDGLVEAMEHKTHPWMIAVLWHPELSPDDVSQKKLLHAFIEAARKNKLRRSIDVSGE
ncbi:MAG: gamma-glutamyl-gamma-aminobutyrate hydrolase family protein [Ignavibacteriales bacterium]|nr:gamma-glutamyl-gamma-aminobutyrate hydrolase family protein [Ignavibacteriales bacterium]